MELSNRLLTIISMVENCDCILDVGTDHGYVPIYLVENKICKKAIASDVNLGPVKRVKENVKNNNLENEIECRLGSGFSIVNPKEVNTAIIAGMGGNLIRDIIDEDLEVFKELDYLIIQPVQNPEVIREYIYMNGYKIIDEELCIDEEKYYEIIKIKYDKTNYNIDPIYYEIGQKLIEKKHPLINEFLNYKISKYEKILSYVKNSNAEKRKKEVKDKISKMKELIKWV